MTAILLLQGHDPVTGCQHATYHAGHETHKSDWIEMRFGADGDVVDVQLRVKVQN